MKVPLNIEGEWSSPGRLHDADENMRSIAVVMEWLEGVEVYLREGGDPAKEPVIHAHDKSAATRGFTSSEYDGVKAATLRSWLKWWRDPKRTKFGTEEAGREPSAEIAKLVAELEARRLSA